MASDSDSPSDITLKAAVKLQSDCHSLLRVLPTSSKRGRGGGVFLGRVTNHIKAFKPHLLKRSKGSSCRKPLNLSTGGML